MVELKVGNRLILNDNDWKVNVFEVIEMIASADGKSVIQVKQVKGRMTTDKKEGAD